MNYVHSVKIPQQKITAQPYLKIIIAHYVLVLCFCLTVYIELKTILLSSLPVFL